MIQETQYPSLYKKKKEKKNISQLDNLESLFTELDRFESLFSELDRLQSLFTELDKLQSLFTELDKLQSLFTELERLELLFTKLDRPSQFLLSFFSYKLTIHHLVLQSNKRRVRIIYHKGNDQEKDKLDENCILIFCLTPQKETNILVGPCLKLLGAGGQIFE